MLLRGEWTVSNLPSQWWNCAMLVSICGRASVSKRCEQASCGAKKEASLANSSPSLILQIEDFFSLIFFLYFFLLNFFSTKPLPFDFISEELVPLLRLRPLRDIKVLIRCDFSSFFGQQQ